MRSGRTSRTTTSWPSSAKEAAVTRPTQPAPTTPSGSLAIYCARPSGLRPLAMAIIVSFESRFRSVFTTQ